ncbi:ABC transporter permease [Pseudodonghicola flavimaris]|uniref:ABC transporter permease n=1 Tax=Pseudodonghicola flavimaris TaxID=3050036 RepID=A0ABT7F5J6_9RHOB|nr:ABC transporter permease [Pseudodonghicola flavimaris]MDK3019877.1 ABC transporter permease [Pseudodonghicola flavimaris]
MAEKTMRGAFPLSTRQLAARVGAAPIIAAVVLSLIILAAIFAPFIAPHDPILQDPVMRLKPPSGDFPLGTDNFGRDLLSRVIYGARVSLVIGIGVTIMAVVLGLAIGLVSGFFRTADAIIMRIMDGLMAMPSVLLAIAIVSLMGASIWTVMAAITIPEIPRVVRLVRSIVLTAREEPYVEAAIALGTSMPRVLWRHLMPNTFAPLTVQATYVCASAILTEAILSFLGAGVSTETPTWGNIMAEARIYFRLKPMLILWPGLALSLCILSINLLGDAARDILDPRMGKRED